MTVNELATWAGLIVAIGTIIYGAHWSYIALKHYFRPVKAIASVKVNYVGVVPGSIGCKVSNLTNKPIIISECYARGVAKVQRKQNFWMKLLRRKAYKYRRQQGFKFDMMKESQVKIEPHGAFEFEHVLGGLSGYFIWHNHFETVVITSTGRKFLSDMQTVPKALIGRREPPFFRAVEEVEEK